MTAGGHGFEGVESARVDVRAVIALGAGKTTLSRMLVAETPALRMSVSATDATQRPGEIDGKDYYFVDQRGSMP